MSRTRPSNVIPLLGTSSTFRGCDSLQLAAGLRRVHAAGLRRDFVLLAPLRLAEVDLGWWTAVRHAVLEQTHLWIALVEPPCRDVGTAWGAGWMSGRTRVIGDLAPEARAGVIELSYGVVSDDRCVLEEAGSMGVPGYDRARIDAAIGGGDLRALLERPIRVALASSA